MLPEGRPGGRGRSWARYTVAVPTLLLLCTCLGCTRALTHQYNPDFDEWPLCRYWSSEDGAERNLEALGPVVEWHDSPTESGFYLRPLFNRRNDKESQLIRSDWLYPFGSCTFGPDLDRWTFYPLFAHNAESFSDGLTEKTWTLLPLFHWKRGRGPTDFFLVPLGGVLHDFWDREKVAVVLWPLFVFQQGKEVRSWSCPHPIFTYVRWDDGAAGYKVWPLFGYHNRPGKFKKLFVLWPIGHYLRSETPEGPQTHWGVFPFYTSIVGPKGFEWHAPWPFVSHRLDDNVDACQEDWWYLWPFAGRRTGKDIDGWFFRPIYSTVSRQGSKYVTFLWPLGWYTETPKADEPSVSFRVVPLMFYEREETQERQSGAWQAWPLVKYGYDDKWANVEFPSLFPYRHHAEWERNFGPFFRVFEYDRSKKGVQSWRFLWRVVRVDSGPEDGYIECTPLFRIHRKRTGSQDISWNVLKGLAGYERIGESRSWQLFYFIRLGSKGDTEAEAQQKP